MTIQDLPRFEAFEEWEVQLAPGTKPKAKRKKAVSSAADTAALIIAVEAEWKLLRRLVKVLASAGSWIGDAIWENIAEWFRDLRRRIITFALGALVGGGGYAHQEYNLFGLKREAPTTVAPAPKLPAANDNADPWHAEVHRETKRAARK